MESEGEWAFSSLPSQEALSAPHTQHGVCWGFLCDFHGVEAAVLLSGVLRVLSRRGVGFCQMLLSFTETRVWLRPLFWGVLHCVSRVLNRLCAHGQIPPGPVFLRLVH